jgi:glutamyl-tRNA synthetase
MPEPVNARPVRVRVAPSPTGDPHVGTAYQALYNYAFAKSRGGKFILRIEDTDQARSTRESEAAILESLRWLGLPWDEGPDVGGPCAPYRQSERTEIYRRHVDELLEKGHAYRCFCTPQRLEEMRFEQKAKGQPGGYDRLCRGLSPEESARRAAAGEPFVVRMKVPLEGHCVIRDLLHGEIHKDWASVDDQVLLKSDGFPTYHLANVVDDRLMGISHVIRGEEWINSVPKHLLLYEYFGWEPPVFCHLPLLRNNDKDKTKLSKRKNPTSIAYYRSAGFLPEALVNFLALMGSAPPGEDEKFPLADFIEKFKLEEISLGGPVFDVEKLRWLNGRYIRESHAPEQLLARLKDWALSDQRLLKILPLAQPRLETLGDWGFLTAHFFADAVPLDATALQLKGRSPEELQAIFQVTVWEMERMRRFEKEDIQALFAKLEQATGIKLRDLTRPFYVAVTGATASTPIFDSMAVLGSDVVRIRLRRAIAALGPLSAKRTKELEEQHRAIFGARED